MSRQSSRKVVAFSLFGPLDEYIEGAFRNAALYGEMLPDFTPVFYVGDSVPSSAVDNLCDLGAEVVLKKGWKEDWTATMWRFHALRDAAASHFLFRDCDSRPSVREIRAVRAWEASFKGFHVMRDHPAHHAAMLAGMWGVTGQYSEILTKLLPQTMRPSVDYHEHYDQTWLHTHVWPLAERDSLTHASYWRTYFGPTEPFPTARIGNEFVGEGLYGDDSPRYPDHKDLADLCRRCSCALKCDK